MNIYLIRDYFRVDGISGQVYEKDFERDFVKYESSIELECAKNEYVSFQVIFDARESKLDRMEFSLSDLTGPGAVSQSNYEAYIEWFHKINGRYIPDALIPYDKTKLDFRIPLDEKYLKEQKVGALWIDLYIPAGTEAGSYKGTLSITADAVKQEFDIKVRVHDVALCSESKAFADLNAYADSISHVFAHLAENPERYEDGSYFEVEREFYRSAYEHRCVYHNLPYKHSGTVVETYAPELEGEGASIRVKSWETYDRHFGPLLDGSAFEGCKRGAAPVQFLYLPFNFCWPSDYVKWGKKGYRTEFRRILREFTTHFEEKGWTETNMELFFNHKKRYRFFPFDGDETRFEDDAVIFDIYHDYSRDIFEETKARFIFRTDSSWSYGRHLHSRYLDICNMWVVGGSIFSWFPEGPRMMEERNNIAFIYGGVRGGIAESLQSLFYFAIRTVMLDIDGFTLWNSTGFGSKDPLETPEGNGSTIYWYPGSYFGYKLPVPSLRLKALRNYMQLIDMMKMAKGSPKLEKIKSMINGFYNADNSLWWKEKPALLNDPPHTWTNAKLSDANAAYRKPDQSPELFERMKAEVLRIME